MKIQDLIDHLETLKAEHGNLRVVSEFRPEEYHRDEYYVFKAIRVATVDFYDHTKNDYNPIWEKCLVINSK